MKIISIPYFPHDSSNEHLTPSEVKSIIKQNQIFDNIVLMLKLHVIKVSPKSDMLIIWIDIWDVQSRSKAKSFINRCFNVGRFIVTIWGANMNPSIPQCKNCWQWGHMTMFYCIQGSKCNGSHKTENHHQFGWYCKVNEKTNPPHLEIKKGKPCLHSSKCSNCCGDHEVDSNLCLFWKHRFHYKWHIKEYNKIHENKSNLICSTANNTTQWFVTS